MLVNSTNTLSRDARVIVHVRLLCNFGPKLDGEGYRGLSVQLKPTYELTPADRIWLHEHQYQSTTIALCHVTEEVMAANLQAVRKKVWATTGFRRVGRFRRLHGASRARVFHGS